MRLQYNNNFNFIYKHNFSNISWLFTKTLSGKKHWHSKKIGGKDTAGQRNRHINLYLPARCNEDFFLN